MRCVFFARARASFWFAARIPSLTWPCVCLLVSDEVAVVAGWAGLDLDEGRSWGGCRVDFGFGVGLAQLILC